MESHESSFLMTSAIIQIVRTYRVRHPFLRFLAQKFSTKISYRMFGGHQLIESWFLLEKKDELLV